MYEYQGIGIYKRFFNFFTNNKFLDSDCCNFTCVKNDIYDIYNIILKKKRMKECNKYNINIKYKNARKTERAARGMQQRAEKKDNKEEL